MNIKVMTFNIHHGKGSDGELNLNRIVQVLKESEADVIGLNEVDRHFSNRSDYMDQITWMAKQLNMNQAYGAAITLKPQKSTALRQYGNALLSRFPIVDQKNHLFDFYTGVVEGRSLLEVDLQAEEQLLKIYISHLSLNPFFHNKQTDFIVKKAANDHQPVILLGDFNMKPGARAWKKITEHLMDVCDAAGKDSFYTFPSHRPKSQLDYIFVSRNFHIASVDVLEKKPDASDHLPLQATLTLNC